MLRRVRTIPANLPSLPATSPVSRTRPDSVAEPSSSAGRSARLHHRMDAAGRSCRRGPHHRAGRLRRSAGRHDRSVRRSSSCEQRVGRARCSSNRGGPGAEGASLALNASGYFEPEITDNFDIIGWDPRGTGQSEGVVDCIDDDEYDRFFANYDVTPDDQAERDADRRPTPRSSRSGASIASTIFSTWARTTPRVTWTRSVRRSVSIRSRTSVSATAANSAESGRRCSRPRCAPRCSTVRAIPNADPLEASRQQGAGFEAVLDTFLAQCSADSSCPFHNDGDAAGAYDRLMASLDESPLPER